jgi:hypothetical protein
MKYLLDEITRSKIIFCKHQLIIQNVNEASGGQSVALGVRSEVQGNSNGYMQLYVSMQLLYISGLETMSGNHVRYGTKS